MNLSKVVNRKCFYCVSVLAYYILLGSCHDKSRSGILQTAYIQRGRHLLFASVVGVGVFLPRASI